MASFDVESLFTNIPLQETIDLCLEIYLIIKNIFTIFVKINVNHILFDNNYYPAGNYVFKVNNRNTGTRCEICSKLKTKTPERRI